MNECNPELVVFKSKYFEPHHYDLLTNLQQTIGVIRISKTSYFESTIVGNYTYTFPNAKRIFDKVCENKDTENKG